MYSYSVETPEGVAVAAPRARRRLGAHLEVGESGVRFADPVKAASQPSVWIEAFRVAIAHGCGLSDQAIQGIRDHAPGHAAEDFVATRSDRTQLRKLLHPRPGLYDRLVDMRRSGLLHVVFPEMQSGRRSDVSHLHLACTNDDRDLAPIRALEGLRQASGGAASRFRAMLDEVNSPELLTLALLLDRRGSPRDDDGALARVGPALDRLQLNADARESVEFLIARRSDLMRLAFQCDTLDPAVIADIAGLATSDQRLKMFCLVAFAHVQAFASSAPGAWKADLLWQVYVSARQRVLLGEGAAQADPVYRAVALAGRPADLSEADLTQLLDGVPDRYLAIFGLAGLYDHARLARGIRPDDVHTALERHDDVWRLTLVSLRTRQLFAYAAGVLSRFGMDIHRAQALTTPDDLVLDVFEFSDPAGLLTRTPGATSDLDRAIRAVSSGGLDVDALVDRRPLSSAHRRPAVVQLRHDRSNRYTVVEIVADDAPGLLHRISRAVVELGCDVDLALVSTEGERAHDVLHVTRLGRRLSDADRDILRERLLEM